MSLTGPTITTERLLIRPMIESDAADLALRRSDPEVARFQSWTTPYSREQAVELIASVIEIGRPTPGHWFQFALDRTEDGATVGDIAFHIADDGRNGEIGFTLHRWAWGNGYALEAASAIVGYAFSQLGLHRVEASVDPRNAASVRLLERLGMRHEGTSIESYWTAGVVSDDAHYAILTREWPPHREAPLSS